MPKQTKQETSPDQPQPSINSEKSDLEELVLDESTEDLSKEQKTSSEEEENISNDKEEKTQVESNRTSEKQPEKKQVPKGEPQQDVSNKGNKKREKAMKQREKKAEKKKEKLEKELELENERERKLEEERQKLADTEQEKKADKEWVKMEVEAEADKEPEKEVEKTEDPTDNVSEEDITPIIEKQKENKGKQVKKKEMNVDTDAEKQTAFENMWNKAIQESQKTNDTLKPKSQNDRSSSNSSKGVPASSNKNTTEKRTTPEGSSPSITARFCRHLFQALLDLTHTNYTAFGVNLLWHSAAVYYLVLRPRKVLLANAVVSGGKNGVPHFAIDTVKFLGGIHAAWALLSLLSFRIRDVTAQKAILLAFTLANFSHLYFNVSALATGRWRIWFTKITAGSTLVTLVNLACYLASVKKNGRYL
ncbi:hypothetical protein K7432_003236 [Basidiobolus ranarum]|uniref:Uncharacterized protein n=1 Tax=Basidiobolus ranarum TaxID=34480 RepID=A0ABR2W7G0_9FUNG